jgi:hypothetical protein
MGDEERSQKRVKREPQAGTPATPAGTGKGSGKGGKGVKTEGKRKSRDSADGQAPPAGHGRKAASPRVRDAAHEAHERIRVGVREKLAKVFHAATEKAGQPDDEVSAAMGQELEEELFSALGPDVTNKNAGYQNKLRSLQFNMKQNQQLVERVLKGQLLVRDLVNMSDRELATDEQQAFRRQQEEAARKQHVFTEKEDVFISKAKDGTSIITVVPKVSEQTGDMPPASAALEAGAPDYHAAPMVVATDMDVDNNGHADVGTPRVAVAPMLSPGSVSGSAAHSVLDYFQPGDDHSSNGMDVKGEYPEPDESESPPELPPPLERPPSSPPPDQDEEEDDHDHELLPSCPPPLPLMTSSEMVSEPLLPGFKEVPPMAPQGEVPALHYHVELEKGTWQFRLSIHAPQAQVHDIRPLLGDNLLVKGWVNAADATK